MCSSDLAKRTYVVNIDNDGPFVKSATPIGAISNLVDHFDVTLDGPIANASFTTNAVSLVGARAPAISGIAALGGAQWRIQLASAIPPGDFTLSIGPGILDEAGNPMNQNRNGVNGEVPGDVFTAAVSIRLADLKPINVSAPANLEIGRAHV